MLNVRLAGDHLYGKLLFTWLTIVMSMMVSFCAVLFPTRCHGLSQFLRVFLPTLYYGSSHCPGKQTERHKTCWPSRKEKMLKKKKQKKTVETHIPDIPQRFEQFLHIFLSGNSNRRKVEKFLMRIEMITLYLQSCRYFRYSTIAVHSAKSSSNSRCRSACECWLCGYTGTHHPRYVYDHSVQCCRFKRGI